jgi:hypothetical protein
VKRRPTGFRYRWAIIGLVLLAGLGKSKFEELTAKDAKKRNWNRR